MSWLRRTHGIQFELLRHFLARMFDGEWSSTPGQWRNVAVGALAFVLPAGVILLDTDYAHKYDALSAMPIPGPFRAGALADELGILTLVFGVTGLLALFEWQSLFPSARDYLALAGYPIRSRQIFVARFGAVLMFSTAFIAAMNLLPSILVPLVMRGRWQLNPSYGANVAAHAIAASLACYFVFFAILALQGVLLNALPGRLFARVSAYVQGSGIAVMMLAALYSWQVKDWPATTIDRLPRFGAWLPPVWFGGLHEILLGARDPFLEAMARRALLAAASAALLSLASYVVSYRRYRRLLLESPSALPGPRLRQWSILRLLAGSPRREAIMHFMAKTLVRSRTHRMIWMAYLGFAAAVVVNSSLIDGRLLTHHSRQGTQFLVLFWPLAASVILMNGFRHVISIPAELKANWLFRITESQGRKEWMSAVERFVIAYAIAPIYLVLAPVAFYCLGFRWAVCMLILQVLCSLFIFEVMFSSWQQLPFACSYVPGKKPMIAVVSSYILIVGIVVPLVSFMVAAAAAIPFLFPFYLADFLFLWLWVRRMRRDGWGEAILLYEDQPAVVHDLGIKEMTYGGTEALLRRPLAGDAGYADSQNSDSRPDARLRGSGVHPADLGGCAASGGGSALSGAPSPGTARPAGLRVGTFGEQPARQVLPPDTGRTRPVGRGVGALEPHVGGHLPHHAAGLILRLRGLFLRRRLDRDLDDEMAFHLAMREQKYRDAGMSPQAARAAARRQFGNATGIQELCRDLWTFAWFETLWQDVRYGMRQLRRSPGFTVVAAVTLALGVGGATAIYSLIDTVLWGPVSDPELRKLVVIAQAVPGEPHSFAPASAADLADLRRGASAFSGFAAFRLGIVNVQDPAGQTARVDSAEVSPSFFDVAGVRPALGRGFEPGEERVAVLSDELWRSGFGGVRDLEGVSIRVDGLPYSVIGVMPPGFALPRFNRKLWTPLRLDESDRQTPAALAIGRLWPGSTARQAAGQLDALAARLPDRTRRFVAWTYPRFMIGDYAPLFGNLLLGAAVFVLLIACANVASLQFARAAGRTREIALRTALGAARSRIVRQLVTESVVLGGCGALAGLLAARWGLAVLKTHIPAAMREYIPGWSGIGLHLPALGFALACAVGSGLVVGLAPAWRCSRADIAGSLKGNARTGLRNILVAAELAAALVLLIGGSLMVRGFGSLLQGGRRFEPKTLLVLRLSTQSPRPALFREALERMAALPGVRGAAALSAMPFSRASDTALFHTEGSLDKPAAAQVRSVSASAFRTLNIPLLAGRLDLDAPNAAIISESMARRWRAGVGQRLQLRPPNGPLLTVAGIAGDVQQSILSPDAAPTVYLSYEQFPWREMDIALRTAGDARLLAPAARAAIRAIDPEQPVTTIDTMETMIYQEAFVFAYMAALMGIFGLIALALSGIGVYGVMAYVVSQRQHEIGVRMALGAPRASVIRMLVGRGLRTAAAGLLIGLIPAYVLARWMHSAVWGVKLQGPAIFLAIPLALLAAATMAVYIPASRGTRIEPTAALRAE